MGRFSKAALASAAVAFVASRAGADGERPPVLIACTRISDAEELEARVRLLFAERQRRPEGEGLELHCDSRDAWVMWGGERLIVSRRSSLTDAFLDTVDARLARDDRAAERASDGPHYDQARPSDAPRPELSTTIDPTPQETPRFDRPARSPKKGSVWPERYRPEGGLSIGADADSSHGELKPSVGPRFELGIPLGMFTVMAAETARFGSTPERSIMSLGVEAGIGFGAPYARGAPLGIALRAGGEWLIGHTRNSGEISRTTWAPALALGLRTAVDLPVVPWVGIDTRVRLAPLELGSPLNVELPQVSALLTVGIAYLADAPDALTGWGAKTKAPVARGFRSVALAQAEAGADAAQTP